MLQTADKGRSKGHIIARSEPGFPSYFHGRITSLPIFKIFRRFDERIANPEETRDELFAAIELLCKVAINFSIR